jgi:hypothetical protein
MQHTGKDRRYLAMKRLICIAVVALIVSGLAAAAQAGSSVRRPPTTASLMPTYGQAAKYWQKRGLVPTRVTHGSSRKGARLSG